MGRASLPAAPSLGYTIPVQSDRPSGAVARDGSPSGRTIELDGYRALLLDKAFRPLRAVGWRRALLLGLSGRVEVLEYYERRVRTPSSLFALPAVRQPTLIVAGTDDPIIPVINAHILNTLLPHSRLHLHPGGHIDLVHNALELAPVVDEFLAQRSRA